MGKFVKHNYVVVREDGVEFFDDVVEQIIGGDRRDHDHERRTVAEAAIREWEITSDRDNPQPVTVKVHELLIVKGKMERDHGERVVIHPSPAPLTEETFRPYVDKELAVLPAPFKSFVYDSCWSRGHSYGYDEVLGHIREMVPDLMKAIKTYDLSRREAP